MQAVTLKLAEFEDFKDYLEGSAALETFDTGHFHLYWGINEHGEPFAAMESPCGKVTIQEIPNSSDDTTMSQDELDRLVNELEGKEGPAVGARPRPHLARIR